MDGLAKKPTQAPKDLLERRPSGTVIPRGWKPKQLPRGNPERAAASKKAAADARAAELAPIIAGLRAEGVTSVRRIADALTERKVPTVRGGRWHPKEVQRLLKRIETLTVS